MKFPFAAILPMLVLLSGCVVGPDHAPPDMPLPAKFGEGKTQSAGDVAGATWWAAFRDKKLNGLVEQGIGQNLTIQQAMERIQSANANVDLAGSSMLPQLNGSATEQVSRETGSLAKSTQVTTTSSGQLSASWMLDLFGQYRRSKESAAASLDAAYANVGVARLSFLSDLTSSYIDARYFQQRIALSRKSLASRRETLKLTRLRFAAGDTSQLDIVQTEGLVNSTLAEIPGLEAGFQRSAHHIATLLGLPASSLVAELQRGGRQPVARFNVKAGIPADLIRNRPDIARAERELAAAVAAIGVAEAQFYPSISLGGSISPTIAQTSAITGRLNSWSFGPSLQLPIFDGGRNKANLKIAISNAELARLTWRATVLQAVEEVENAMVAHNRDARTVSALRATVGSYQEALRLATSSYQNGASSLLDVLDAQRSVSQGEALLAQAIQQMARDYVALNVAIGGGYGFEAAGQ